MSLRPADLDDALISDALLWMKRACLIALLMMAFAPIEAADAASITVAWDSSQNRHVIGYRVYVGTQPGVYPQVFDAGENTSFTLDVPDGRRYYVAVAAYTAGPTVGPLSAEVSEYPELVVYSMHRPQANVPLSQDTRDIDAGDANGASQPDGGVICWEPQEQACYSVHTIARTSVPISSLAVTPDDRLFFIEDGRHVRIVAGSVLIPEPALTVWTPSVALNQVVVHPQFSRTRTVYVSETESRPDGSRQLHVARYREVQNRLGERAAVISGLELPASGDARLTVDSNGRLYVAMPATHEASGHPEHPYDGFILRLTGDGTVPRENRIGSPIFAKGFAQPTALLSDEVNQRLWLAGIDPAWAHTVTHVDLTVSESGEWPSMPRPRQMTSGRPLSPSTWVTALGAQLGADGSTRLLSLSSSGILERTVTWQGRTLGGVERLTLTAEGRPIGVASGRRGELFVVLRAGFVPTSPLFAVLRLEPRNEPEKGP